MGLVLVGDLWCEKRTLSMLNWSCIKQEDLVEQQQKGEFLWGKQVSSSETRAYFETCAFVGCFFGPRG
jgi:hypothetical protein